MAALSLDDLVWIDASGYHYLDYPSFLLWRQQQLQNIYGSDIYLENDSQDGQLVAIQAKADYDTATKGAATYNSFSPLTAQGVGLSRCVKINGLAREIASYSTAVVTLVGVAGTPILNGIAQDTLNQLWNLPATVVIPIGGSIDVTVTSQAIGFITADSNTITTVYTPTAGWQTVNNSSAAIPGNPVETDAQLRIRQSVSTSNPAQTVFESTVGAVENVAGVTKVGPYENATDSNDGNGLPPNSICLVVSGGTNLDICNAIASKKTPGTQTYGGSNPQSVVVYDNHGMPLTIKFDRTTTKSIQVTITGTALPGYSADFAPLIQESVAAYINSLPIGATSTNDEINPLSIIPSAYLNGVGQGTYNITAITIGINSGMQGTSPISLNFDWEAVTNGGPTGDVTVSIS